MKTIIGVLKLCDDLNFQVSIEIAVSSVMDKTIAKIHPSLAKCSRSRKINYLVTLKEIFVFKVNAIIICSLEIFLKFANFERYYDPNHLATHEKSCILGLFSYKPGLVLLACLFSKSLKTLRM